MKFDTNLPLVVAGNGPSLREVKSADLPAKYVLFRCNFFFLEMDPPLKREVDAHFSSVKRSGLLEGLDKSISDGSYSVRKLFFVNEYSSSERQLYSDRFRRLMDDAGDHWAIIAENPRLARFMMGRPLPTQGFQMAAVGAVLGFNEIHFVGLDLYSGEKRYAYDVPLGLSRKLGVKHSSDLSYEEGAHSMDTDLAFLSLVNDEFNLKMLNYSSTSPLRQIIKTI